MVYKLVLRTIMRDNRNVQKPTTISTMLCYWSIKVYRKIIHMEHRYFDTLWIDLSCDCESTMTCVGEDVCQTLFHAITLQARICPCSSQGTLMHTQVRLLVSGCSRKYSSNSIQPFTQPRAQFRMRFDGSVAYSALRYASRFYSFSDGRSTCGGSRGCLGTVRDLAV